MSAAAAVASTTQSPSCVAPAAAACKQPTPAAGGEGGADHAQADASSLPCLSHAAAQQLRKLVPAAAAAVRRLRFEQGLERLRQLLLRLRSWVWYWIDELLEVRVCACWRRRAIVARGAPSVLGSLRHLTNSCTRVPPRLLPLLPPNCAPHDKTTGVPALAQVDHL
jgi:hypothetical protein